MSDAREAAGPQVGVEARLRRAGDGEIGRVRGEANHRGASGDVGEAGPAIVLVGPPGAGKSSVGALLAERLGVRFRDTDTDVERIADKPISDIFIEDGEPHFRDLERQAVRSAVAEHDGVLSLGGGAVLDASTRALLTALPVVFLDVTLADAVRRVGLDAPRPLLAVNPRQQWRTLMERRRPLYTEVARAVVSTEGRTPDEVAQAVLDALKYVPGGPDASEPPYAPGDRPGASCREKDA